VNPGPTFDRVYLALKAQLTSGRFPPGEHLEPASLGDELNASITPVRDALHRLVGERIVEAPRNDGFRVPAPTEAELRDLYRWNRELLDLAVRRRASGRGNLRHDVSVAETCLRAPNLVVAELFRHIAALSGNPEHELAVASLNDRLGAVRISEERLFEDWAGELEGLREAYARDDMTGLRRGIGAYHRRRQRCVPELLVDWRRLAAAN
jgi:DNA-binding GntR family transcriptional regulator